MKISGADSDFHRRDLWEAIEAGAYPEWELGIQIFDEDTAERFSFDVLDATKLIPSPFWNSQTDVEKQHIINAFRFELTKVQTTVVRKHVVAQLLNVANELTQAVADGRPGRGRGIDGGGALSPVGRSDSS